MAADLEFYFDPVCPWAWITSRWVTNVQQLRNYEVSWRFISLKMINAERGYANNSQYEGNP
jgi:predicted DsbA family dithiol-disulfide isomerase